MVDASLHTNYISLAVQKIMFLVFSFSFVMYGAICLRIFVVVRDFGQWSVEKLLVAVA